MHKANWLRRGAAWMLGLSMLIGIAAESHAQGITNGVAGWNLIRPTYCAEGQFADFDILYVYKADNSYLYTTDPVALIALAQYCANGNAFYVYVDGSTWSYILTYPNFK